MSDFMTTITTFPTVIFTFLLVLLSMYWLLVIIGAVGMEIFDIGIDDAGDSSGGNISGLAGFFANLGLSGVPVTLVASIITSLGWLMTSAVTAVVFPHIASPHIRFIAGLGLLAAVVMMTIPITARMIRPLRKFFSTRQAVRKSTFVGQDCIVKSLTVTETFGQGEVADGEAGIIIDIVANVPNDVQQGDSVLLIEYDDSKDIYYVSKI